MITQAMKDGIKIEAAFAREAMTKRILVVGDIMLDRYVCGEVDRISPEAPVPVVKVTDEYHVLGGSGNVIRNIRELGANVSCVAAIGNDVAGRSVMEELEKLGVDTKITILEDVPTIQKTRVVAGNAHTQMLRVDREKIQSIDCKFDLSGDYDVIVVSDYAKGMVTAQLMADVKALGVPIIVDPKPENMWLYNDVFMITPNKKEYDEICTSTKHPFTQGIRYILRTLGKDGMELISDGGLQYNKHSISAIPVDVFNVSGAGDTVVAVMAVCLALDIAVEDAAETANVCAKHVVTQPDTSVVPENIFYQMLYSFTRR